jgi:hypothetical protein
MINVDVISIDADASGCQEAGGRDFPGRVLSPGFWHVLGTAMGLRRPTHQTFIGDVD